MEALRMPYFHFQFNVTYIAEASVDVKHYPYKVNLQVCYLLEYIGVIFSFYGIMFWEKKSICCRIEEFLTL